MSKKARLIAIYLPQYFPFKQNDEWWGKGFTEWTNVGRAKSYYPGHVQPKVPKDLGYYDLRVPETRKAQAEMAKYAGIEGFCYWHYYFGDGKRLMERPFAEVLDSGNPDFPFCLGWANHSWHAKNWNSNDMRGVSDKMLIEQKYNGLADYKQHFDVVLPAFKDRRYMTVDGKPIFMIWQPFDIPNLQEFLSYWRELAVENGLPGIYFVGFAYNMMALENAKGKGLDAICADFMYPAMTDRPKTSKLLRSILRPFKKIPVLCSYDFYSKYSIDRLSSLNDKTFIPCIVSNFDHSPRSHENGVILTNSTPAKFCELVKKAIGIFSKFRDKEENLIFIKSWNEWGEGNYLEPDFEFGTGYIDEMHKNFYEK